ncbi:unnamed protein product [Scytosiphon promiscuus]
MRGSAAGAASPKTVDRVLGVLVAACASALLVALGARAGASFTTLLRLAYEEHFTAKRKSGKRRSAQQGEEEEEGDAYFEYAHGSRSATATAAARARAAAAGEGSAGDGDGSGSESGGGLVLHLGSCHCGGLAFEVQAPEHLVAIEGPSKVRYPFITVPAEQFRLTSDDSNGSLYLLKCRPPAGRDDTPKVSAHFFCRRCGVHVVHAPDFPHAAVADVNVHCINRSTIKSLAVAFLRGGGGEVPGMGDPVEGIYEVGRESWSDAMRERVSVALREQHQSLSSVGGASVFGAAAAGAPTPTTSTTTASTSRALSPRRRSASDTTRRGHHGQDEVQQGRREIRGVMAGARAGGSPFVGGGVAEAGGRGVGRKGEGFPDFSTLRRGAEDRERARRHSGAGTKVRTGDTWGDVLMHVVSLPSSTPAATGAGAASAGSTLLPNPPGRQHHRHHQQSNGLGGKRGGGASGAYGGGSGGSGWGVGTSELLLRAERDRHQQQQQQQQQQQKELRRRQAQAAGNGGVVHGVRGKPLPRAGKGHGEGETGIRDGWVPNGYGVEGEVPGSGIRRRRARSVDSTPATPGPSNVISSPGAEGVTSKDSDDGEEPSGGSRSLVGSMAAAGGAKNNGTAAPAAAVFIGREERSSGGGGGGGRAQSYYPEGDVSDDRLLRPPSGVTSGGFAAAQA